MGTVFDDPANLPLREVAKYLPTFEAKPLDRGLSSSRLWKIGSHTTFCLKLHPPSTSTNRLVEIQSFQQRLAEVVPEIPRLHAWPESSFFDLERDRFEAKTRTLLKTNSGLWEKMDWKEGVPLTSVDPTNFSIVLQGVQLIARMHDESFRWMNSCMVAPGLVERRDQLSCSFRELPRERGNACSVDLWRAILQVSEFDAIHRSKLHQRCAELASMTHSCHWILRDLWRANVLCSNGRITGLVDFAASRIDWPGLDLSRFLSSMIPMGDLGLWNVAVQKYRETRESLQSDGTFEFNLEWIYIVSMVSLLIAGRFWLGRFREGKIGSVGSRRLIEIGNQLAQCQY